MVILVVSNVSEEHAVAVIISILKKEVACFSENFYNRSILQGVTTCKTKTEIFTAVENLNPVLICIDAGIHRNRPVGAWVLTDTVG